MPVYKLDSGLVQHLMPVESVDWEVFWKLTTRAIGTTWRPVSMHLVPETAERPASDFPHLSPGVPVFSSRAVTALGSLLTDNGELLPIGLQSETYYAFNVNTCVDALHEEGTVVRRFNDGRTASIRSFSFHPHMLQGLTVFRIPQVPISPVFVTDSFVQAVDRYRLTGFSFVPVWEEN